MRKPTSKELFVAKRALEGLRKDLEALESLPNDVSYADVLGTMGVNLFVLRTLHDALSDGAIDVVVTKCDMKVPKDSPL